LPIITLVGSLIPALVSGSVIVERIFSLPGIGQLFFESVLYRDYTTIMGLSVLSAILTLFGILLADILYAIADPRISYGRKT
ncbi:MAG TPA: ABC transporter permease subunit, partial [Spirochaetota bacterium]|nr:ABC transporter permease subunit [Spirochaetota bacterium]